VIKLIEKLVFSKPWLLTITLLGLTAGLAVGVGKLGFEGEYRIWFSESNEQLNDLDLLHAEFTKADSIAVVVKPNEGDIYSHRGLTLLKSMTDALWQTPMSSRADSLVNYQYTESVDGDLIVDSLLRESTMLSTDKISKIRAIASNEPMLVNRLVSKNGDMALINISVNMPGDDLTAEPLEISEYVKNVIHDYRVQYPEFQFYRTGIVGMNASFIEAIGADAGTLMPLLFVIIVVVLGLATRSVVMMLATTVVIALTVLSTLGFAGWLGLNLNNATINVPIMIMTLAVADCLHIIVTMYYRMRRGLTKENALRESLNANYKPILITSVTTALGFLTMNFSEAPPMQDLGNLVAFGVMLAFFYSITLLPVMLRLSPLKSRTTAINAKLMRNIASLIIRNRLAILPASVIVTIALGVFVTKIDTNDEPLRYFGKEMEFRQAAELMAQHLSGITAIEYAFSSGVDNGINSPQFLATLSQYTDWLREQPEVDHVLSLSDIVKQLSQNMHDGDRSHYRIPNNHNETAQYLLLYEMSLPFGLDLKNLVNIDKSATRVIVTLKNIGSKELVAFEKRSKSWLTMHATAIKVNTASTSLVYAHIGERNIKNMLLGVVASLLIISLILIASFRSVRYGLISVLPNVLPVIVGFGVWGLLQGQINMALAVVASMTIGIIVDDTVHFLLKYKEARMKYRSASRAVHYVFANVGSALFTTTIVLCVGFGVLLFSQLDMNANIGLLTIIVIIAAFVIDFIVLPAFLVTFDKAKQFVSIKETSNEETMRLASNEVR